MSILSGENLGHSFGDHWLFRNLNFSIATGQKVALVGHNGAGKSTLLKILAGNFLPNEGSVVNQSNTEVGYLAQDPSFGDSNTVNEFIFNSNNEIQNLINEYEQLTSQTDVDSDRLQKVIEEMTNLDAWDYENRFKTILSRFGITDLEQSIETLSGGQKKRLSLAKLLIDDPEVYILDEPTNHLDIDTIEWLEKILTSNNKTVLFVTHDRYFLDNICTEIREIDQGKVHSYKGKYSYFLEKKQEREEIEKIVSEKAKNLLRKELEWMRRQPKARGTKSKSRIEAFHTLKEKSIKPQQRSTVSLGSNMERQGNKIVEIESIYKNFGSKNIIKDFSYTFKKSDKIGLIGSNGSGKTTFINLITQNTSIDSGTIDLGETTKIGYYKQEGLVVDENKRVIEIVTDIAEHIEVKRGENITASQLLTRFLFSPEKQYGFVNKLSGGERKRLQLMRVLMANPNFLILDEPSNDLDIDTLNILEEFLVEYEGVLILVSHDRYLVDKICNQLFIFEGMGNIRLYNGNYSDYLEEKEYKEQLAKELKALETPILKKEDKKEEVKTKLTYKEKLELESIESSISELEELINTNTDSLNNTTDYSKLEETANIIKELQQKLDTKMERWMYLSNFE